jgi:hypothetical protein
MTIVLLVAAVPASAHLQSAFPRERIGTSILATSGGGVVTGDDYATRTAVIAWSRRFNTLTLYLLWRRHVTCGTLLRVIEMPGHLIQVHVTSSPRVHVGRPMANPEAAFLTIYRAPKPEKVAGLKNGARLAFASVNSYPGGVWRGRFDVPTRIYGDGKLYGYHGTFAAKFCSLR